jgi:hypothetical protein
VRSATRYTLGIATIVHVGTAPPPAAGQAAGPNACSLFDAAQLQQLTGRKDILGKGPQASSPSDLPKYMSECDFLEMSFTLTTTMTPEWFARNRQQSEARPDRWKVQSTSGLGDEGYYLWDPRPGPYRSVGIVFRVASKQVAVGSMVPSDSVDVMKSRLLTVAKQVIPRLK